MIAIMEILGTPSEEEMAAMNPFFNRKEYDIMPKVKGRNWKDVRLLIFRFYSPATKSSLI